VKQVVVPSSDVLPRQLLG